MNQTINNTKQKESSNSKFWMLKGKNSRITLIILLFFGFILAIFSTDVFITYAKEHVFMNSLRDLFQIIYDTLSVNSEFQTPENKAHLFNICIFNFYYTNYLLLFSPRCIFSLIFSIIPNTGIIDMIIGYGLILFSLGNLILLKFDLSRVFSNPIDPIILHTTNSLAIIITLIGFLVEDMFILGFCGLYWALICFYIVYMTPFGNKK